METKTCRHCKQEIHKQARRCQHCHSSQSWFADQKDPRTIVVLLLLIPLLFFPLIWYMDSTFINSGSSKNADLSITQENLAIVTLNDNKNIVLTGYIVNQSTYPVSNIWFQLTAYDQSSQLVDNLLIKAEGLVIPENSKKPFRIMGMVISEDIDLKKTNIKIIKARKSNKWD